MTDDTTQTIQDKNTNPVPDDYNKLNKENLHDGEMGDNATVNKFDEAFNKSSQEVQDYILGEDFPKNIAIICKLQKLYEEKESVMVENMAVSILVGLLSTGDAKKILIESFGASGIILESFSADLILKDIDAYILAPVRKQILRDTISNKNIRHLTLGEEKMEKDKEELRKILLEKTGNVNGRGGVFKYQNPLSVPETQRQTGLEKIKSVTRESLLGKINLNSVDTTDKDTLKERMGKIKIEEVARIEKLEKLKKEELVNKLSRDNYQKEYMEGLKNKKEVESLDNTNQELIGSIKEKLENGESANFDLDNIIRKRELEELEKKQSIAEQISDEEKRGMVDVDPYRESV